MATWSSAYITALPDSAFACIDSEGRHYPHHNSSGALDLPHLRAALSRLGDASNTQCGKGHIMRHARAEGMGESAQKALKATVIDDDAFRLLAIPFGAIAVGVTFLLSYAALQSATDAQPQQVMLANLVGFLVFAVTSAASVISAREGRPSLASVSRTWVAQITGTCAASHSQRISS